MPSVTPVAPKKAGWRSASVAKRIVVRNFFKKADPWPERRNLSDNKIGRPKAIQEEKRRAAIRKGSDTATPGCAGKTTQAKVPVSPHPHFVTLPVSAIDNFGRKDEQASC
jgi:hypothetical protein